MLAANCDSLLTAARNVLQETADTTCILIMSQHEEAKVAESVTNSVIQQRHAHNLTSTCHVKQDAVWKHSAQGVVCGM